MSDWQHSVGWLLAKYCRCKLRPDSCWCRWRTSVKGRSRWGLQVWRRQVGLVRGTRWPAKLSVDRIVARTARWSRGRFLGWATKPRSSRDFVGAKSWVVIGGGLHQVRRVCGGSPENHRLTRLSHKAEDEDRAWLSGQNRPDRFGEPVWPVSGRRVPEASRLRTRVGIARLVSRLRGVRSPGIHPMVL
jgi:hypothetical protein